MQSEIIKETTAKKSKSKFDRMKFFSSDQNRNPDYLEFSDRLIRRTAEERLKNQRFAKIFLLQTFSEWRLLFLKQVNFRRRQNNKACQAYCEMTVNEFEMINARQQWANWRTIPRNLNGRLPNRPLRAIDLCCGTGQSTEVLSHYLPNGSQILGLEYNPEFVEKARNIKYLHKNRELCKVSFRAQSVLDPFRDEHNNLIEDASIDLVNSCGAVGSHFDVLATQTLAHEIARVVRIGGLATIDCGLPGTDKRKVTQIFESSGFVVLNSAKSCLLDPFSQVCFQRI
jgi:SAM-dependent methyltransferase